MGILKDSKCGPQHRKNNLLQKDGAPIPKIESQVKIMNLNKDGATK